ncbi:membrane protein containing DUF1232 [Candidatus Magnetoovum chiemensis]|nr:membrane protein containing DUF1232 [Candidatus Magnetoovum chiemensis]
MNKKEEQLNKITVMQKDKGERLERNIFFPLIIFILALIYDIFPFDLIPDVPLVGWGDDLFITLFATINLIQKAFFYRDKTVGPLLGKVKWGIVFFSILSFFVVFSLFVLLIVVVVKLVT